MKKRTLYFLILPLILMVMFMVQTRGDNPADAVRFSWADSGYVTPVRHHQYSCKCCRIMAACAMIESQILWKLDKPDSNVDLSEQMMLSCWNYDTCCAAYMNFDSAIIHGIPAEDYMPWQIDISCIHWCTCFFDTCDTVYDYPYAWASFIDSYGSVDKNDTMCTFSTVRIDSLKQAIVDYGPIRFLGQLDSVMLDSLGANVDTGAYSWEPYVKGGYGH